MEKNHVSLFSFLFLPISGTGSYGTVVYEGEFDHRPVAIKRLVLDCCGNNAAKEISLLIDLDQHRNLLRYYAKVSFSFSLFSSFVFSYLSFAVDCCGNNAAKEISLLIDIMQE